MADQNDIFGNDDDRQDQQRDQGIDRQQNQQNQQQRDPNDPNRTGGEDESGAGYGNNAGTDEDPGSDTDR